MKQQKAQETKFHYYMLKLDEAKNAGNYLNDIQNQNLSSTKT